MAKPAQQLVAPNTDSPLERDERTIELSLGQWFWVQDRRPVPTRNAEQEDEEDFEWLGCVMRVGSNYLELAAPSCRGSSQTTRVLYQDFWKQLRAEPNPDTVIQRAVQHWQAESARLLAEVQAVTARLGVHHGPLLPSAAAPNPGTALVTLTGQRDLKAYRTDLELAQEQTLPALFAAIKNAHAELERWLTASLLPMQAMAGDSQQTLAAIKGRIFNVALYAGLTEQVVCCREGTPAAATAKLHVMQRRLYMDEECLLDYRAGGMEFKDIQAFDAWLGQPQNRDRILPFPRTLVAMRVRRTAKDREFNGNLLDAFINLQLADSDQLTFLYIRNGEQVWRLSCDLEFGELVFPDREMFDLTVPLMVKISGRRIADMMHVDEYAATVAEYRRRMAAHKAWRRANPKAADSADPEQVGLLGDISIGSRRWFRPEDWSSLDQSNVYFDDCMADIRARLDQYNRIAVIIQGLFDRSPVLHPHPAVRTWTAEGFAAAIELVYDGERVLTAGPAPDFEAYRAQLNESLGPASVTVGQQEYWIAQETAKERKRIAQDWRIRDKCYPTRFIPYGDPGPGELATMASWQAKGRKATFTWERERRAANNHSWQPGKVAKTVTVPATALLNVSAYRPGDYRQFFADVRTRAQYLQWAPLLLAAEDYHASQKTGQGHG